MYFEGTGNDRVRSFKSARKEFPQTLKPSGAKLGTVTLSGKNYHAFERKKPYNIFGRIWKLEDMNTTSNIRKKKMPIHVISSITIIVIAGIYATYVFIPTFRPGQLFGSTITTTNTETLTSAFTSTPIPPTATITPIPPTATPTLTPTAIPKEIVWDFTDPEVLPTKSFEYLTSTEFALQVLDWESQDRFPEVPDTAVPVKTIDLPLYTETAFLRKYGYTGTYGFPEQPSNPVGYRIYPMKIPYVLAGVWKTQYQEESAFFILKKWKNLDGSAGFEGYIYKTKSTNPKAITWELIDLGFKSDIHYPTGSYFIEGTNFSNYIGLTSCGAYFSRSGNPDSAFCKWYYDNPNLVFNKELYYRWQRTGILSNYITENNQKFRLYPFPHYPVVHLVLTNNFLP